MQDYYFGWTSDTNGDGVPETLRYSTTLWIPTEIDHPDGGRHVRVFTDYDINGRAVTLVQTRPGKYDQRVGGQFTLTWDYEDDNFTAIARQDYALGRLVSVRLDHRWRQCRVTSSGAADRKLTVAAGWVDISSDTAYLDADYEHTCSSATHTKVYATNSSGSLSVASGTSVPAGAVELATISITGDVVTVVSDPSGAANARTCRIVSVEPSPRGDALDRLSVVLQEIR